MSQRLQGTGAVGNKIAKWRELFAQLQDEGELKLWAPHVCGISLRTLKLEGKEIRIYYGGTKGSDLHKPINILSSLLRADAAYTNYWLAYAQHLMLVKYEKSSA